MTDGEERRPEGGEGAGANWRTMMATFVTRLEREHEALLEALRERLDGAEARSRRLEERVAQLEERLAAVEGRGTGSAPAPTPEEEAEAVGAAPEPPPPPAPPLPAAASAPTGAADLEADSAPAPAGGVAAAAAVRPPGQEAAEAILRREAEVLRRAAAGESALAIANALGRSVGEVELVLHLARRVSGGERWPGQAAGMDVRALGPPR
ncbi:MAG: hypothetical protein K6V73_00395 [Firmicutes bacterium]|nr:hypothetical protein [Bacillota bacterium]